MRRSRSSSASSSTPSRRTRILELKIYRLARLEILIIRKELEEKRRRIRNITALLKDEPGRWGVVRVEIEEIQKKYGDARRTAISSDEGEAEYTRRGLHRRRRQRRARLA